MARVLTNPVVGAPIVGAPRPTTSLTPLCHSTSTSPPRKESRSRRPTPAPARLLLMTATEDEEPAEVPSAHGSHESLGDRERDDSTRFVVEPAATEVQAVVSPSATVWEHRGHFVVCQGIHGQHSDPSRCAPPGRTRSLAVQAMSPRAGWRRQPQASLESTSTSNGARLSQDRASPDSAPLRRYDAEPAVARPTST